MHVKSGHFNWRCANVLIGVGDPHSTDAAKAFESAAEDNNIDVCTKANYESDSSEMAAPIKQIIGNRCCLVTVVFGQARDISSLLLEAHRQNYAGEWIMGDNVIGSLDSIVKDLNNRLDERSTHKLLRGMFALASMKTQSHIDNFRYTHKEFLDRTLRRTMCRHIHGVSQASQKQGIP